MKILDVEQNSTAWSQARLGVVTASEIDALVSPALKIRTGDGPETYLHRKVAEKLLNYPMDLGATWSMDQGNIVEKIARPWFAFTYDCEVKPVGLCLSDDGRIGCSPDGFVGDDMGLEIKSPMPHTHLKYLLNGEVPPCYLMQVHFSMFVTGRPRWMFVSFSRQFPPLVLCVERHAETEDTIKRALAIFFEKFDAAVAKVTALQSPNAQPATP